MPQQHDPGQLCEGLCNVEVAQRANLKEGHTQALGVGLGLFCGHLPLECQMQPVSHQDFRNPRGMLEHEKGKESGLSGVPLQIHVHPELQWYPIANMVFVYAITEGEVLLNCKGKGTILMAGVLIRGGEDTEGAQGNAM